MNSATGVPDLLQRFVPTPHVLCFCIDDTRIFFETNDLSLVDATWTFGAALPEAEHVSAAYRWKVIRDHQVRGNGQEITILSSDALSVILRGTETIITIDRQLHEVLAFIGPDVSRREFTSRLVPIILELSRAVIVTREEGLQSW
jgi:hypothetical protein